MRTSNALLALILVIQLVHLAVLTTSRASGRPYAFAVGPSDDPTSAPLVQCAALPEQQRLLASMIVEGIGERLEHELRLLAARLSMR